MARAVAATNETRNGATPALAAPSLICRAPSRRERPRRAAGPRVLGLPRSPVHNRSAQWVATCSRRRGGGARRSKRERSRAPCCTPRLCGPRAAEESWKPPGSTPSSSFRSAINNGTVRRGASDSICRATSRGHPRRRCRRTPGGCGAAACRRPRSGGSSSPSSPEAHPLGLPTPVV